MNYVVEVTIKNELDVNEIIKNNHLDREMCKYYTKNKNGDESWRSCCRRCHGRGTLLFDNPQSKTEWVMACSCVQRKVEKNKDIHIDDLVNA